MKKSKKILILAVISSLSASDGYNKAQSGFYLNPDEVTIEYPSATIDLIQIEKPRITAGCSGIDLFHGSINMLSTEEYIAFLETLVQNTGAVMMKLALKDLMPSMGGVVDDVEMILQQYNLHNLDSCRLAEKIAQPLYSQIKTNVEHMNLMQRASDNTQNYNQSNYQAVSGGKNIKDFWDLPKALAKTKCFKKEEALLLIQMLGCGKSTNEQKKITGSLNVPNQHLSSSEPEAIAKEIAKEVASSLFISNIDNPEKSMKSNNRIQEVDSLLEQINKDFSDFEERSLFDYSESRIDDIFKDYRSCLEYEVNHRKPIALSDETEEFLKVFFNNGGSFAPPIIPYISNIYATRHPQYFTTVATNTFGKIIKRWQAKQVLEKFLYLKQDLIRAYSDMVVWEKNDPLKEESDIQKTTSVQMKNFENYFDKAEAYFSQLENINADTSYQITEASWRAESYIEAVVARQAKIALSPK